MTKETGKSTVGTTSEGARNLDSLMETGWFSSEVSAYKTAIGVALAQRPGYPLPAVQIRNTKWNIGTLDKDGRLSSLIDLITQGEVDEPYEYAEQLADLGLDYLKQRIVDQDQMLSEVLTQGQLPMGVEEPQE